MSDLIGTGQITCVLYEVHGPKTGQVCYVVSPTQELAIQACGEMWKLPDMTDVLIRPVAGAQEGLVPLLVHEDAAISDEGPTFEEILEWMSKNATGADTEDGFIQ